MSIRRLTATGLVTLGALGAVFGFTGDPAQASEHVLHQFSSAFGTAGAGNGEFNNPVKVAVDEASGDVYVADLGNGRVQKFDTKGNYLSQFNGSGTPKPNPGEFSPRYIAVDNSCNQHKPRLTGSECEAFDPSAGDVYVLDTTNNVVDKFNVSGAYVSQFAGIGALTAVTVDSTGNVLVLASNGNVYIDEYDDAVNNNLLSQAEAALGFKAIGFGISVDSNDVVYFLAGCSGDCVWTASTGGGIIGQVSESGAADVAVEQSTSESYIDYGTRIGDPFEQFGLGLLTGSKGVAVNSANGTVYVADFESNKVDIFHPILLPVVTVDAPSNVHAMSVTLNGTVVPKEGQDAHSIQFEYGTTSGYGTTIAASPMTCLANSAGCEVTATITGLLPNKTYYYRLDASNNSGGAQSEGSTVTTTRIAPSIDQQFTEAVTPTSAIVDALINPNDEATNYHIEYGTDSTYGTSTPVADAAVGSSFGDIDVGQQITGLWPATTYHYRVVATNPTKPTEGPDQTFTTAPLAIPVAVTGAVDEVSQNSATISGTVNPEGVPTGYEFDLGTDTTYGARVFGEAGSDTEPRMVSLSVQGLAAGTFYHYRLVATNTYGTVYGADMTFTTPGFTSALLAPPIASMFIPVPAVSFPGTVLKTSGAKAKRPAKRKVKKKLKKKVKGKRASGAGHRRVGKGRGK